MRIRPDGIELLQAARVVIERAIVPNVADEYYAAVRTIERALALAEQRLAQDETSSTGELAELEDASAAMRGEVLGALPQERRYDARLVAKAIAVATRQLANGALPERHEYERLAELLDAPRIAHASSREIRRTLFSLNERLGMRIRAGEADFGSTTYAATLAHLEAITQEALSESNPAYPHRPPGTESSQAETTPCTDQPEPPLAAACAAWSSLPFAFLRAVRSAAPAVPIPERFEAWLHFNGAVGEALCASGSAALATQADLFGWFAHRLAANPRVPMIAVESAHQAHDALAALAEASAEFCKLALAPFRRIERQRVEAARVP